MITFSTAFIFFCAGQLAALDNCGFRIGLFYLGTLVHFGCRVSFIDCSGNSLNIYLLQWFWFEQDFFLLSMLEYFSDSSIKKTYAGTSFLCIQKDIQVPHYKDSFAVLQSAGYCFTAMVGSNFVSFSIFKRSR